MKIESKSLTGKIATQVPIRPVTWTESGGYARCETYVSDRRADWMVELGLDDLRQIVEIAGRLHPELLATPHK